MNKPVVTRDAVRSAIRSQKLHPSVPEILTEVINLSNKPNASIAELVHLIEKDPSLSARLLRIANSGFYSTKRRVTSIREAVVTLGWNSIKMIALGATILKRMSETDQRLFNHSVLTARIARFIAQEANLYKVDEIAVVGLLHDIGIIILEVYFPERFLKAKQLALDRGMPIHLAEQELLGNDHAAVGGWTLAEWKLPENISASVAEHHSFDPATYHARKTAVIQTADVLALAVDYTGPSWEKVSELNPQSLEVLGFTRRDMKDMILAIMKMKCEPLTI